MKLTLLVDVADVVVVVDNVMFVDVVVVVIVWLQIKYSSQNCSFILPIMLPPWQSTSILLDRISWFPA